MSPTLRFLVWLDRGVNFLIGGSYYQTLSARAYETASKDHPYWGWTQKLIDGLFFWDENHCQRRWIYEQVQPFQPMGVGEMAKTALGGVYLFLVGFGISSLF